MKAPQTNDVLNHDGLPQAVPARTYASAPGCADGVNGRWILHGRVEPDSAAIDVTVAAFAFTIGRAAENDLCLRNPTVSGKHARLELSGKDLLVRDLQSTNGTFLNGHRVCGQALVRAGGILQFGTAVFELQERLLATSGATMAFDVASDALALLDFNRLFQEPALVPFFQPIVRLCDESLAAYEVLARSNLLHLETPQQMFRIAASRDSECELSALARWTAVQVGQHCNLPLFINTHPCEIGTAGLLDSLERLRAAFPQVPLCLEIHEAAITSAQILADLRNHLKDLSIDLAYDDFGAGQARLLELVEVPPNVIKFDISLIQGLGRSGGECHRLVESLVNILQQFGVTTLAEGVESREQAEICREVGFDLAQGYLFGRPQPLPPETGGCVSGPSGQAAQHDEPLLQDSTPWRALLPVLPAASTPRPEQLPGQGTP
jgi:EAL domain-containing protein (putative c-di-GMP-specific phosphodiesterase class I)